MSNPYLSPTTMPDGRRAAGAGQREREGMSTLRFFVPGVPKPAGSKRVFPGKSGKFIVTDASGKPGKDWKDSVRMEALRAAETQWGPGNVGAPLFLTVEFVMKRPESHYGCRRGVVYVKDKAPFWHTSRPDSTKLLRAVEDALTGVLWEDDALIAKQCVTKRYSANYREHGAVISVETMPNAPPVPGSTTVGKD